MTSVRHNASTRHSAPLRHSAVPQASSHDPVLDAVRACVLDLGVRRTTLTEVARRAGVSRMTLYRRAPDVDALILELLAGELAGVIAEAERAAAGADNGRRRLVETAVEVVTRLSRHELMARVLALDPEVLLPYLTARQGSTQRLAADEVRRLLDAAVADGSVRPCDTGVVAAALVHVVMPFVVGRSALPHRVRGRATGELELLLDRWLAP